MENKCFVLMPFKDPYNDYYKQILVPAIQAAQLEPIRADEIYGTGPIIEDIIKGIKDASALVADVTEKNPNVNYELGIAHALGRPVVIISQSINDIPFDYQHLRAIIYDTREPDWASKLKEKITNNLRTIELRSGKDEWLLQIEQIVKDYYKLKDHWFDVFKKRATTAIEDCCDMLHSLVDGKMAIAPDSAFRFDFGGIKSARESIKTVTYQWDWWRSDRSKKYFEENVNAILLRNVKISRIFIVRREKEGDVIDKDVIDIVQQHQSKGIEVCVVYADKIPNEYNESFTILDDKIVVLRERTGKGVESSREKSISIKPVEVKSMIDKFDKLWQYGHTLEKIIGSSK